MSRFPKRAAWALALCLGLAGGAAFAQQQKAPAGKVGLEMLKKVPG